MAIGLRYKAGILQQAITRGDGTQGDDVTTNVKTIKSIPVKLKGDYPEEFEIRGEIFMHRAAFERMNAEREREGLPPFANPRNSAAGTIKMQESSEVARRPLDCFLYNVLTEDPGFRHHYENLRKAHQWGFPVSEHIRKCKNMQEVFAYIKEWDKKRNDLSFDIDGVVVKVNSYDHREELGYTAKIPRWSIAYKFKAETAVTQLLTVTYQVGRTGAITPVANLKPVKLGGTTVKRASLYNQDQIVKLDLREGDTVFVEKGGEIIPKIVGVDNTKRAVNSSPLMYATQCPECGSELVRKEGEALHYCPNESGCPPQVKGKIVHFIGRKAMNIDSLGAETVEMLYDQGLVKNYADLYKLRYEDLIGLERMAEKSVNNLLSGIENTKNVPFERVLFALGIRLVGETGAKKLSRHFKSIETLMEASYEELIAIDEIGGKIAENVIAFFADPVEREIVNNLVNSGLHFTLQDDNVARSNTLENKSFLVSGVFTRYSRDEIKSLIEANGGRNVSSVSTKLDYLIAGDKMGPEKLKKAEQLKVKIITEDEFVNMLSGSEGDETSKEQNASGSFPEIQPKLF